MTVDQSGPTAELSIPSNLEEPLPGDFPLYVSFSEDVKLGEDSDTGFLADYRLQAGDFTLTSGSVTGFLRFPGDLDQRRYTAVVDPGSLQGELVITLPAGVVQDAVGNPNEEASVTVRVDSVPPTVEITSRSSGYVLADEPFSISIAFSEEVSGFAADDISVTGGTLQADSVTTSDNTVWTATVTAGSEGETVKIDIAVGAARDLARSSNRAAQRFSIRAVNVPGDPRDLRLDEAADGTLVFSWLGPATNGGAPLLHYQYRYGPKADITTQESWTDWARTDSADTTSLAFSGLTNGVEYALELGVRNGLGFSKFVAASGTPNPKVTIESRSDDVPLSYLEGDAPAWFRLWREGDVSEPLTVPIEVQLVPAGTGVLGRIPLK